MEVAGFPESHVNEVIDKVIENINNEENIKVIAITKNDAKKLNEMFAGFLEIELEFNDLLALNHFCFDYLPSSVEILNKETLEVSRETLSLILNDMLTNMHKYQMNLSNLNFENEVLRQRLTKTNEKSTS